MSVVEQVILTLLVVNTLVSLFCLWSVRAVLRGLQDRNDKYAEALLLTVGEARAAGAIRHDDPAAHPVTPFTANRQIGLTGR